MEDLQVLQNEEEEAQEEKSGESTAQDKVNQRREARRRKILANAKSRLEKLNGRGDGQIGRIVAPKEEQNCEFSDPEVEPDIVIPERVQSPTLQALNYSEFFSAVNTDMAQEQQKKHFLLRSRLHILVAATISYILSMIGKEGVGGNYSVFIPAGILIALEFTYFREQRQINPITSLLITICGIRSQKANRIFHLLSTIQNLIIDVGIFVFFYCTITFLLVSVNEKFVNLVVIK